MREAEGLSRKRVLAMRRRGSGFKKRIFQELCHGLQDFPGKLIIRYRSSHAEGAYERAITQDRLRSCTAPIISVRFAKQSRE